MSASSEEQCIVVGLGAVDHHSVSRAILRDIALVVIDNVLALQLTNFGVVERDIVVEVSAIDQAVISYGGNALCLRSRHDCSRLDGINRSKHQNAITVG